MNSQAEVMERIRLQRRALMSPRDLMWDDKVNGVIASVSAQLADEEVTQQIRREGKVATIGRLIDRSTINEQYKNKSITNMKVPTQKEINDATREAMYPSNKLNRGD